ncbi:DUF3888 domain-containing protein [Gracilibacillus caseinilyticus]|uniref:DUF3888 domain-containing protein n=1 Tax=Gracilibacillus caseinilyticus TaxID=2932256 RepID=A0ABY4ESX3_9BACI|nr:DUF3888 domain-containing protein [Gracilibacillus caseinilyticus]UOQ46832.1 DUF3888 domain-containing protein [Gracilibacillus caseinilyticus]
MRKHLILILGITFIFLTTTNVYAQNELKREELLEEALIVRYLPHILEVTDNLFMCERITNIKRLGGNRDHEVVIEVVTFEKAHMPPYNLFRIKLIDTLDKITVTEVERTENISSEQLQKQSS